MKRATFIIAVVLIAFGVVMFFVPYQKVKANNVEIELFDSCHNVKFIYKNGTSKFTQVTKVKYFNSEKGDWKTETIPFNYCSPNQTNCSMPVQDLQGAEGDNITKIIFEFKTSNSYQGPWDNSSESQEFHPNTPKCNAGRSYGNGTTWVVSSGNSASNSSNNSDDSGSCKNVSIKVTNGRNEQIRFKEVSFYNKSSGKWKDDNLPSYQCLSGQTCTIDREANALANNLLSFSDANGDDITKIKIGYEYLLTTRGSKWSSKIESKIFEPSDPVCREGKVYGNGQKWTIGNSSNNSTKTDASTTTNNQNSGNSNTPTGSNTSTVTGSQTTTIAGQSPTKITAQPPRKPAKANTPIQADSTNGDNNSGTKVATPAPKSPVKGFPKKKKP